MATAAPEFTAEPKPPLDVSPHDGDAVGLGERLGEQSSTTTTSR